MLKREMSNQEQFLLRKALVRKCQNCKKECRYRIMVEKTDNLGYRLLDQEVTMEWWCARCIQNIGAATEN